MKNEYMLIGEIADYFGVSRKTMRLYEKKGIISPIEVDEKNGYRYYSAEQIQQMNAVLELKAMGFSLDEIRKIVHGDTSKEVLLELLEKKMRAWNEAMQMAMFKMESVGNIIANINNSPQADHIMEMTEEERAWLLVKMVCIEDLRVQKVLSEALWV